MSYNKYRRLDKQILADIENSLGKDYVSQPDFDLGTMPAEVVRNNWLVHRHGIELSQALRRDKPVIVSTGFGLTENPHLGTVAQIKRAVKLQNAGIPVQIVLGDADAYLGRGSDYKLVCKLADSYYQFIIAQGFSDKLPSSIRRQTVSDLPGYIKMAADMRAVVTPDMYERTRNPLHTIYVDKGVATNEWTRRRTTGRRLMIADFLYYAINGNSNIIIMLGIDEWVFGRLAEETSGILTNQGKLPANVTIGGLYSSLLPGFWSKKDQEYFPKQSKSIPGSGIILGISDEEIERTMDSGEGPSREPNLNPIYQMMVALSNLTPAQIANLQHVLQTNPSEWAIAKSKFIQEVKQLNSIWLNTIIKS